MTDSVSSRGSDAQESEASPAMVDRAMATFTDAINSTGPCERCKGVGYHHGFGEHGHDPDWCEVCGGSGFVPGCDDKTAMKKAIDAALAYAPPSDAPSGPLAGRPTLITDQDHPLVSEVGQLRQRHQLLGCVLVSFTGEPDHRVGVNSSGSGAFGPEMERLADRLLAAIDDGQFDPAPPSAPAKGRGWKETGPVSVNFPPEDYAHTAALLRDPNEKIVSAALSNNYNIILHALDMMASGAGGERWAESQGLPRTAIVREVLEKIAGGPDKEPSLPNEGDHSASELIDYGYSLALWHVGEDARKALAELGPLGTTTDAGLKRSETEPTQGTQRPDADYDSDAIRAASKALMPSTMETVARMQNLMREMPEGTPANGEGRDAIALLNELIRVGRSADGSLEMDLRRAIAALQAEKTRLREGLTDIAVDALALMKDGEMNDYYSFERIYDRATAALAKERS